MESFMHLSDEKIAKLIDGKISKKERLEYLSHISECHECFEVYTDSLRTLENREAEESRRQFLMVIIRKKRILPLLAAMLLLISLPFVWKFIQTSLSTQQATEWNNILVAKGEKKELTLDDGTRVFLDSGSSFKYPQKFIRKVREVSLTGEGYFEVRPDEKKPFLVNADYAVIKVVGTKFNVRAWQQTQRVEVSVAEGRVSLHSRISDPKTAVLISNGQQSILPKNGRPSNPVKVNIEKYLGWINRNVEFVNTPLLEILNQLERWYDIRFVLHDDISVTDQLTVHIQNKPLKDILELIADLMTLEYEQKGKTVYLHAKN
jgi:ferric-dicitrate binding protein FerR (iron transport regulator)